MTLAVTAQAGYPNDMIFGTFLRYKHFREECAGFIVLFMPVEFLMKGEPAKGGIRRSPLRS
ncbi:hypothetical protein PTKU64_89750 [Paraburkholderia terrae]|uniref:Uncharacterized protein n=1 Tax=Paraburkholderia terrae TaxID=311230 RepID=A0ABM7U1R0_9BURK|nr:hypothetical protein [Paraburkholderia terrae]BCZ85300.1 hypothetical protein PTKU64_89750 [Paraburkholderia terrae]